MNIPTTIFGNKIIRISSVLAGIILISGTAWSIGDYTEIRPVIKREFELVKFDQEKMSGAILQLQFQTLYNKQQFGKLDFVEQQQLCKIAKQLDYVGIDGCFGGQPTH